MAHQAHHGLRRVELLGHQGLGTGRRRRRRGLVPSHAPGCRSQTGAAVLTAVAVILVLAVRGGLRAEAASSVSAVPAGGRRALALPAAPCAAVLGAAATAAANGAHAPVALVLVHEVRVVGAGAATEARPTAWNKNRRTNYRLCTVE